MDIVISSRRAYHRELFRIPVAFDAGMGDDSFDPFCYILMKDVEYRFPRYRHLIDKIMPFPMTLKILVFENARMAEIEEFVCALAEQYAEKEERVVTSNPCGEIGLGDGLDQACLDCIEFEEENDTEGRW